MFLHVEKSYLRHIRLIRLTLSKVRIIELTIFFQNTIIVHTIKQVSSSVE